MIASPEAPDTRPRRSPGTKARCPRYDAQRGELLLRLYEGHRAPTKYESRAYDCSGRRIATYSPDGRLDPKGSPCRCRACRSVGGQGLTMSELATIAGMTKRGLQLVLARARARRELIREAAGG